MFGNLGRDVQSHSWVYWLTNHLSTAGGGGRVGGFFLWWIIYTVWLCYIYTSRLDWFGLFFSCLNQSVLCGCISLFDFSLVYIRCVIWSNMLYVWGDFSYAIYTCFKRAPLSPIILFILCASICLISFVARIRAISASPKRYSMHINFTLFPRLYQRKIKYHI